MRWAQGVERRRRELPQLLKVLPKEGMKHLLSQICFWERTWAPRQKRQSHAGEADSSFRPPPLLLRLSAATISLFLLHRPFPPSLPAPLSLAVHTPYVHPLCSALVFNRLLSASSQTKYAFRYIFLKNGAFGTVGHVQ